MIIPFLSLSLQVSLNLMCNKLETLSDEISLLKNLKELKIEGNRLRSLPAVLNEMPELKLLLCEDALLEKLDPEKTIWEKEYGIFRRKEE